MSLPARPAFLVLPIPPALLALPGLPALAAHPSFPAPPVFMSSLLTRYNSCTCVHLFGSFHQFSAKLYLSTAFMCKLSGYVVFE